MTNCQICKEKATTMLENSISVCGKCCFQMQREAFFSYSSKPIGEEVQ